MKLTIDEGTIYLVFVLLKQNGRPNVTIDDAVLALENALIELTDD